MRSILQKFLVNKQEEVRATVQALDADQLRAALACLNAAHVVEVAAASHNLSIALEASVKFGSLGKRCVASAIPEKTRAFAATLTKNDLLLVISGTGRNPALEEVAGWPGKRGSHPPHHQAPGTRRWPSRRIMSCWLPTGSSASLRATMLLPALGPAGHRGAVLPDAAGRVKPVPKQKNASDGRCQRRFLYRET